MNILKRVLSRRGRFRRIIYKKTINYMLHIFFCDHLCHAIFLIRYEYWIKGKNYNVSINNNDNNN